MKRQAAGPAIDMVASPKSSMTCMRANTDQSPKDTPTARDKDHYEQQHHVIQHELRLFP